MNKLVAVAAPATLLGCAFCSSAALAGVQDAYDAPDMTGFRLTQEEDGDGNGDGVKETHIRHYQNAAGDRLFSMVTRGRLWAWSRQSGDGSSDADHNFVIVDSNCDGAFDKRYALDDQFHLPECLSPAK